MAHLSGVWVEAASPQADALDVANTVVDGIGNVVNGNTAQLASAINTPLQGLVSPMISFGASQLGLSGLPKSVGNSVQAPRNAVTVISTYLHSLD